MSLVVISTALENASVATRSDDRAQLKRTARIARCLGALAEVLARIAEIVEKPLEPFPHELRGRLPAVACRIEEAMIHALSIRFGSTQAPRISSAPEETGWLHAMLEATKNALGTLRANLRPGSVGVHHAARLCLATTFAFVLVRSLHIPFGYWATMATLFVLQPAGGTTLARSVERAAGSAAGAALAAAIGLAIHSPLAISLVVFPLVCLTMGLRRVSYSLYVVFLTPSFVLVADFATPSNEFLYAIDRLGNNVLGCLAALVATLLIRSVGDRENLADAVERAVEANLAYLAAAGVSPPGDADIEGLRREAGLASTHAEEIYRRNWPSRTRQRRRTIATLSLLRRLLGTAAVIQNSPASVEENAMFRRALSAAIEKVRAQAYASADPPPAIAHHVRLRPIEYEALRHLAELWTLRHKRVSSKDDGGNLVPDAYEVSAGGPRQPVERPGAGDSAR